MRGIESYYRINDLIPSSSGYFPATPTVNIISSVNIVTRIKNTIISDSVV